MSERREGTTRKGARVLATEVLSRMRRSDRKYVVVYKGERVFKVSDHLVATALLQWSEPVQLRLQKREDGTYDLVCRAVTDA